MPLVINVHEAKTYFSQLLEQAHAGQKIILATAGKPYARLAPLLTDSGLRQAGRLSGRVEASYFDLLPESEFQALEA